MGKGKGAHAAHPTQPSRRGKRNHATAAGGHRPTGNCAGQRDYAPTAKSAVHQSAPHVFGGDSDDISRPPTTPPLPSRRPGMEKVLPQTMGAEPGGKHHSLAQITATT